MQSQIIDQSAGQLLNYGVLGVFCIFLIFVIVILWRFLQKKEADYLKRTDKFIQVTENYSKIETEQTIVLKDLKGLMIELILKTKT